MSLFYCMLCKVTCFAVLVIPLCLMVVYNRYKILFLGVEIFAQTISQLISNSVACDVIYRLGTDHLTWRGGGLWFFVSFRIFFSDSTRVRIYFFCRVKREFFFLNLTLDYMTKTLNQIIFFFLHQNQNIFFSNIGNQNIFLEKNHNPPPFTLNGRSLRDGY